MNKIEIDCSYDELVSIEKLVPHPLNRNKHPQDQLERLAKIIKETKWRHAITVSKRSGFITTGHGRLEVAKLLGMKSVPVDFQDYESEALEYQHLIADNEIARWAEFDQEGFAQDLELGDFDIDVDLFGIQDFEPPPIEVLDPQTDEDEVPEVENPITKRGDIWLLGNHRVMCGDSTMIDDVAKLMNGEKADMVFTDPPYGVDYKGINNDSRNGLSELLEKSFSNYFTVSKSGASIYCFHSDKCADIFHHEFRKFFHFSSMIIWNKNSLTLSRTDYQSRHEPCLYGWMSNGTHKFFGDRKQVSVWDIHKESVLGHTTPKPVALIEKALFNSSKGEDLILDLFLGSGSTLIACEKTKRKCYGMELDEKYCDVIIKRWQDYTGSKAVLEGTSQTYEELQNDRKAD